MMKLEPYVVRADVCPSTLKIQISPRIVVDQLPSNFTGSIVVALGVCVWGGGSAFCIKTLASMATDSSHMVIMGKSVHMFNYRLL